VTLRNDRPSVTQMIMPERFINPIDNADNLERAYIKSLENLPAAARKR
jgi:hypothetical protein